MASKKAQQSRANSLSIEVVSNGYKVKSKSNDSSSVVWMAVGGEIKSVGSTGGISGEFVFQDFAGLVSFLRKRLSVPSA